MNDNDEISLTEPTAEPLTVYEGDGYTITVEDLLLTDEKKLDAAELGDYLALLEKAGTLLKETGKQVDEERAELEQILDQVTLTPRTERTNKSEHENEISEDDSNIHLSRNSLGDPKNANEELTLKKRSSQHRLEELQSQTAESSESQKNSKSSTNRFNFIRQQRNKARLDAEPQLAKIKENVEEWAKTQKNGQQAAEKILSGDTTIDLSGLKLTSLPDGLCELNWVKKLNLKDNLLTDLPVTFGQLKSIEELDLSSNNFTEPLYQLGELTNLRKLDLSDNKLKVLHSNIGNNKQLVELIVKRNELTALPIEIGGARNLKFINLKSNNIEALPNTVLKLDASIKIEKTPLSETMWANDYIRPTDPSQYFSLSNWASTSVDRHLSTGNMSIQGEHVTQVMLQQAETKAAPSLSSVIERWLPPKKVAPFKVFDKEQNAQYVALVLSKMQGEKSSSMPWRTALIESRVALLLEAMRTIPAVQKDCFTIARDNYKLSAKDVFNVMEAVAITYLARKNEHTAGQMLRRAEQMIQSDTLSLLTRAETSLNPQFSEADIGWTYYSKVREALSLPDVSKPLNLERFSPSTKAVDDVVRLVNAATAGDAATASVALQPIADQLKERIKEAKKTFFKNAAQKLEIAELTRVEESLGKGVDSVTNALLSDWVWRKYLTQNHGIDLNVNHMKKLEEGLGDLMDPNTESRLEEAFAAYFKNKYKVNPDSHEKLEATWNAMLKPRPGDDERWVDNVAIATAVKDFYVYLDHEPRKGKSENKTTSAEASNSTSGKPAAEMDEYKLADAYDQAARAFSMLSSSEVFSAKFENQEALKDKLRKEAKKRDDVKIPEMKKQLKIMTDKYFAAYKLLKNHLPETKAEDINFRLAIPKANLEDTVRFLGGDNKSNSEYVARKANSTSDMLNVFVAPFGTAPKDMQPGAVVKIKTDNDRNIKQIESGLSVEKDRSKEKRKSR